MDDIGSSYQFHRELESPAAFIRREWQPLAIFGGGFVAVLLLGVLAVDPAYFYPRLQTDPLLYYLKGLAFAETGHTAARAAVNRAPFDYVAMPGILRAPFMLAFRNFDDQLRAIQIANVALVSATAVMYSYILSWVVPRQKHWLAIGYTFAFLLLSPVWVANVFSPLADAPFAVFTVAVVILAARVLCSERRVSSRPLALVAGAVLFTIAFLVKYTAPVLLLYVALLAAGRFRKHGISRRSLLFAATSVIGGVLLLVAMNWHTISHRYLGDLLWLNMDPDKKTTALNLFALALPSQIVPDFQLAFAHNPMLDPYLPRFGTSPFDAAITTLGLAISAVILYGVWRARHRFLPEIWYFLGALPLLGLLIPSTSRYLMPYQPLIWIFFYVGITDAFRPLFSRLAAHPRAPLSGLTALVLGASGLVYMRSERIVGTAGNRSAAISLGKTPGYVTEIASTFRDLRRFLETLPRDRTLLIGTAATVGRWKVISGLDYYNPDSSLSVAAREHDIYVVLECGTLDLCQQFGGWEEITRQGLKKYGDFSLHLVFFRASPHAMAKVLRLTNVE